MKRRLLHLLLVLTLIFTTCVPTSAVFAADQGNRVNMEVSVDGKKPVTVKSYYTSYKYNTYVSLEDLAWALKGSKKAFDIQKDAEGTWNITTGTDYTGTEPVKFNGVSKDDPTINDGISFDAYDVKIDGVVRQLRLYDTYENLPAEKERGIYMRLIDLGLFLGIDVTYTGTDSMAIDSSKTFKIDLEQMDKDSYFKDLDGVYLGDVTTGEKLYGWDENNPTEIASTSKLMTLAIVLDQIAAGKMSLDETYVISDAVYQEAMSEDGTLYEDRANGSKVQMKVGQTWSIDDLLHAMILPSANEAATALAEAVSGSEEEFVKLMNAKAAELGMTTAHFVNPHGLPHYTNSQVTGKMQNKMSAADMFKLCTYMLTTHYDATVAVTGVERHELTSLLDDGYTADNGYERTPYVKASYETLFRNIEGLIGMKTGSTNRAGSCMVAAAKVDVEGETHIIVSVSFGGEDNRQRYESSTVLLKYGQQYLKDQSVSLQDAKDAAKKEIAEYKNPADYRDAQKTEIEAIIADANAKIDEAKSVADLEKIVADAKTDLDKVKTDAQLKEEEKSPGQPAQGEGNDKPGADKPNNGNIKPAGSANTPKTGDNMPLELLLGVIAVSTITFVAAKRRQENR